MWLNPDERSSHSWSFRMSKRLRSRSGCEAVIALIACVGVADCAPWTTPPLTVLCG